MSALDHTQYRGYLAAQSAKGTPAAIDAASVRKVRWIDNPFPDVEAQTSTQRIGNSSAYDNKAATHLVALDYNGAPRVQATAADFFWTVVKLLGWTDSVIADPDNAGRFIHTAVPPISGSGSWFTAWSSLGAPSSVGEPDPIVIRASDAKGLGAQVSSTDTDAQMTMTLPLEALALHTNTTIPTVDYVGDPEDQFLHFDCEGGVDLDGVTIPISSYNLDIARPHAKWRGDRREGRELVPGLGVITQAVSILLDGLGRDLWNKATFGSATPAPNTKPRKTVFHCAYDVTFTHPANGDSLRFVAPRVAITPSGAPVGNTNTEPIVVSFAGEAKSSGSQPPMTIIANLAEGVFA